MLADVLAAALAGVALDLAAQLGHQKRAAMRGGAPSLFFGLAIGGGGTEEALAHRDREENGGQKQVKRAATLDFHWRWPVETVPRIGYNAIMRNALLAAGALGLLLTGCSTNEAPADPATPEAPQAAATAAPEAKAEDHTGHDHAAAPQAPTAPVAPFAGGGAPTAPLTPTPELDMKVERAAKSGDSKALAAALAERGTFRMNDDNAGAKVKYRAALDDYRKALEADPKNEAASKNKSMIEDIYKSMGRPIPGAEEKKK